MTLIWIMPMIIYKAYNLITCLVYTGFIVCQPLGLLLWVCQYDIHFQNYFHISSILLHYDTTVLKISLDWCTADSTLAGLVVCFVHVYTSFTVQQHPMCPTDPYIRHDLLILQGGESKTNISGITLGQYTFFQLESKHFFRVWVLCLYTCIIER